MSPPANALTDQALAEMAAFAGRLADLSGAAIRPHFRAGGLVDDKGGPKGYDPVTAADRDAEAVIRATIKHHYPRHGIHGEEQGLEKGEDPFTWVIDPIDGTRAFITGTPMWGTLIALHDGEAPILGVMDQPFTGERFTGSRLGSFLDHRGKRRALKTRPCPRLADAVLGSTTPDFLGGPKDRAAFDAVAKQVRLVRWGGDCYGYGLVAMGLVDLVIEWGLAPYDVQALIPLVEGAGGKFTCWDGSPADQGGAVVAAGDPALHAEVVSILTAAMK